MRYARTHAPFPAAEFGSRYGLTAAAAEAILVRLTSENRLLEGEFRPGGTRREWTDPGVLRLVRRKSLAKLRHEVEPVEQAVLGRFAVAWQGVLRRRRGGDALLDAIDQLQGTPLPASILETDILPARIEAYDPADLDAAIAAGEIVWAGVEPLGDRDGRIALYLADRQSQLLPPVGVRLKADTTRSRNQADTRPIRSVRLPPPREASAFAEASADRRSLVSRRRDRDEARRACRGAISRTVDVRRTVRRRSSSTSMSHGASFFGPLHEAVGGGYPAETVGALWSLVWQGVVTNDTFHALRAFTRESAASKRPRRAGPPHVAIAASHPAFRRRTLEPRSPRASGPRGPHEGRSRDAMGGRHRTATPRAARCADARGRHGRVASRRLRYGLPGAEGDGGERPSAPRLLCRRTGRDAVCAAGRARPVALASRWSSIGGRRKRRSRDRRPRRHRSGEPLWGDIEMARLRRIRGFGAAGPSRRPAASARQAPSAGSAASASSPIRCRGFGGTGPGRRLQPGIARGCRSLISRPGTDAQRGRDGGPRQRRARCLSRPWRSAAADMAARSRARAVADGSCRGACADRPRPKRRRLAARDAHRGNRRRPAGELIRWRRS